MSSQNWRKKSHFVLTKTETYAPRDTLITESLSSPTFLPRGKSFSSTSFDSLLIRNNKCVCLCLTVLLFHQPLVDVANVGEEITHCCDLRQTQRQKETINSLNLVCCESETLLLRLLLKMGSLQEAHD